MSLWTHSSLSSIPSQSSLKKKLSAPLQKTPFFLFPKLSIPLLQPTKMSFLSCSPIFCSVLSPLFKRLCLPFLKQLTISCFSSYFPSRLATQKQLIPSPLWLPKNGSPIIRFLHLPSSLAVRERLLLRVARKIKKNNMKPLHLKGLQRCFQKTYISCF